MDNQINLVRRDMDSVTANQLALSLRADASVCRDFAIMRGNDTILTEVSRLALNQASYDGAVGAYRRFIGHPR